MHRLCRSGPGLHDLSAAHNPSPLPRHSSPEHLHRQPMIAHPQRSNQDCERKAGPWPVIRPKEDAGNFSLLVRLQSGRPSASPHCCLSSGIPGLGSPPLFTHKDHHTHTINLLLPFACRNGLFDSLLINNVRRRVHQGDWSLKLSPLPNICRLLSPVNLSTEIPFLCFLVASQL